MIYRQIIFILLFSISISKIFGQEIIASDGNFGSSAQGSLSWTLGEPVSETLPTSLHTLTQGFQQNYEGFLSTDQQHLDKVISIYPNPFTHSINLHSTGKNEDFVLYIFDSHSKIVLEKKLQFSAVCQNLHIDLSHLCSGVYFFKVDTNLSKAPFMDRIIKL